MKLTRLSFVVLSLGLGLASSVRSFATGNTFLISPTNGSIVLAGAPFMVTAGLPNPSVTALEFYQDSSLIFASPGAVGSFCWSNSDAGLHSIYVRARFSDGSTASNVAMVLVRTANVQATFHPEFTSLAGLYVTGRTAVVENYLRLTPNTPGPKGGAFLASRQPVVHGFETVFQFRVSGQINMGADGLAFLIEGAHSPELGSAIGFDGLTNCLAVEYDMFMNPTHGDINDNHISVHSRGILANTKYESNSLGWTTNIGNMSDGLVHTTKIKYVPGRLTVFLDDMSTPVVTVDVNLATYLHLEGGAAWVGLTATVGADLENHDVLLWSYTGTSPTIRQTRPLSNGTVLLEFGTVSGSRYQVQYSPDLIRWSDAGTDVGGTGDGVLWVDTGPPQTPTLPSAEAARFYRLRMVQ